VTSGNLTVYLQEECHCGFDQSLPERRYP